MNILNVYNSAITKEKYELRANEKMQKQYAKSSS